jgi:hypothetical protein
LSRVLSKQAQCIYELFPREGEAAKRIKLLLLTEQGRYATGNEAFSKRGFDLLILGNDAELFGATEQILY